jgi:RNA polymerase sigma factor (sigma-70 family)
MMDTETNLQFEQDQQAVQAVRGGDAERYRELVERHERRVFALAWSRLGDAALAEEVAQEAFIRAYQRLWLLGDGAKFSAWIAAITRRVAINCGLRNRRELNKRRRWALEQTAPPAEEPADFCPPETLRQALAGLPAAHRECLVLFYLEGKSGAEAAAALGITESALRVRLHRARAALRAQLERRLGESLDQLRPSRPLSAAVMGAILSSSSAKMAGGAGVGAKVLSWLLPFKFLTSFIWVIGLLPMIPGVLLRLKTIRM